MYQIDETKKPVIYLAGNSKVSEAVKEKTSHSKNIYLYGVTTLNEWFSNILTKTDFDKLMAEMPSKLKVSEKTFHNYRFGKTKIPYGVLMLIVTIIRDLGHDVLIIDDNSEEE